MCLSDPPFGIQSGTNIGIRSDLSAQQVVPNDPVSASAKPLANATDVLWDKQLH